MILAWLLIITAAGGLMAWLIGRVSEKACRWVSLGALAIVGAMILILWSCHTGENSVKHPAGWIAQYHHPWIESLGTDFSLSIDGLSVLMLLLTVFLGLAAIAASWKEIQNRVGLFHLTLMLTLAGVMGVFMARDLFLFYVFWELMLVPMYFLISVWGHENRTRAGWKFFLFTQAGGLFLLLAILGLYFLHGRQTGDYTFDYMTLLQTHASGSVAVWLMAGFLAAFLVKLPAVPLHTWLPDAHTEAPTAGSIILAGLLLKTGAYGLLRFVLPLFPVASSEFASIAMAIGTVGILYGAVLAFAQSDIKRLVAYTSVSHLGFVLLGAFAGSQTALQGAFLIMIAHGLSAAALFFVAGCLQERFKTRQLGAFGGLWSSIPRLGGVAMFFALASLGLPGLANFVGEFLVLAGAFPKHPTITIIASIGLAASAVYALWLMHAVFFGPAESARPVPDLDRREMIVFGVIIIAVIGIGLYPQPILNSVRPVFASLVQSPLVDPADPAPFNHTQNTLIISEPEPFVETAHDNP
jgi:NADH-quinone oxidoreductase subunit M